MKIKNKRGDVPITVLVLGVIAVCLLAIVSFFVSSMEMKKNFDIEVVKEAKLIREKIDLYQKLGFTQPEIDALFDIKDDPLLGRHFIVDRGFISVRYNVP